MVYHAEDKTQKTRMRKRILLLSAILVLAWSWSALASPIKGQYTMPEQPLIVAIQYDQTFIQKDKEGKWTGPLIDFWTAVAGELKRPYVFKEMSLNTIITALRQGTVDVAATTMFVTSERERMFDLSTPFGEGHPAILTPYRIKHEHPWIEAIEIFLSWRTLKAILVLLVVLVFLGIVIWLIERKDNPEDFSQTSLRGIAAGIYWAGSILASGVCLGVNLKTVKGRFFGLLWMMVCALALSAFIASLTHSLTAQLKEPQPLDETDLRYMRLGIKKGSAQSQAMREMGVNYAFFDTDENALNALLKGQIDGYLCPEARAYYFANRALSGQVSVYQTNLKGFLYAFGMPKESPLRRPINMAILKLQENSTWESLLERYGLERASTQKRSP